MAAYLSPVGNEQQNDANGAPLSGGFIYTYAAGTSTPIATYTGSDGLTAQEQPIPLNGSGLPDSPIWLPAGQAVKLVIKDADEVTLRTVDNLTGINDPAGVAAASEWVTYTGEPTYINATSFSVEGDQTNLLQVGRRLKSTNTGGTVYSTISASSYDSGAALTTVTVTNDSGTLDAGLSAVAYGLLSVTDPSIPETNAGQLLRLGGSGTVLQEVYFEDSGNAGTSSGSLTNLTDGTISITPKSSNSIIVVDCAFSGQITAGGAGINSSGQFRLYNATAGADIGPGQLSLGVGSASGANMVTTAPCSIKGKVTNAALTAITFQLRGKVNGGGTVTASLQAWVIREIQN